MTLRLPVAIRVADRFRRRIALANSWPGLTYALDISASGADHWVLRLGGYIVQGPGAVPSPAERHAAAEALMRDFPHVARDLATVFEKTLPGHTIQIPSPGVKNLHFNSYEEKGTMAAVAVMAKIAPPFGSGETKAAAAKVEKALASHWGSSLDVTSWMAA